MGGRPVRVARITVEHQHSGFQRFFEFLLAECNCLVVVVRTNDFEINAVAHEPPADRAIRCLRLLDQFCLIPMVARARFLATLPRSTAILSMRRSRSIMRLVIALLFLVLQAVRACTKAAPGAGTSRRSTAAERSKHNSPARRRVVLRGRVLVTLGVCLAMDA